MNGVHDMGGGQGYGPIVVEDPEPVYHTRWEGRVHGIMRELLAAGLFNLDQFRHAVERIPAERYLSSSYYERWLLALETLVRESAAKTPRVAMPEHHSAAIFAVGDRVIADNRNPRGHTRLARYVRGKHGVVESVHGPSPLPDTRAHLIGIDWEPLYTVSFEAAELWGPDAEARASVRIDLWQSYLKEVHT